MTTSANITCINDLSSAKIIWDTLSDRNCLYDVWDFRYRFYHYYKYPLYFYTDYHDSEPVALLPLQFNTDIDKLEFFGGDYMENNRIYSKSGYKGTLQDYVQLFDKPYYLEYINENMGIQNNLPIQEMTYALDIRSFHNQNEYIEYAFEGKQRKNLKREMRIITDLGIEVKTNVMNDVNLLMDLNIQTFGAKSYFNREYWRNIFTELTTLSFNVYLLTFVVDGIKRGASLAFLYNDVYYYFNTGSDKDAVPNLGKFITLTNIETAIKSGAHYFDAGVEDLGWKRHWKLNEKALYIAEG